MLVPETATVVSLVVVSVAAVNVADLCVGCWVFGARCSDRWIPGAGARVVPEGYALAIILGFNRSGRGCDHD